VLPNPTTVSRNVSELFKKAMSTTLKRIEGSFNGSPFGFSSTTDHWTCKWLNVCNTSFTIHYITDDWTLQNHLLSLKRYPSLKADGTPMRKSALEQATEIQGIIESLQAFDTSFECFL
jgi:hypothetical protein